MSAKMYNLYVQVILFGIGVDLINPVIILQVSFKATDTCWRIWIGSTLDTHVLQLKNIGLFRVYAHGMRSCSPFGSNKFSKYVVSCLYIQFNFETVFCVYWSWLIVYV